MITRDLSLVGNPLLTGLVQMVIVPSKKLPIGLKEISETIMAKVEYRVHCKLHSTTEDRPYDMPSVLFNPFPTLAEAQEAVEKEIEHHPTHGLTTYSIVKVVTTETTIVECTDATHSTFGTRAWTLWVLPTSK